jgi:uracil-DNA glycosylase family 4
VSRLEIVLAQRQVRGCQGCGLTGSNTPMVSPATPTFAVVGEAPGNREAQKREPFIGPAGRLLRRALVRAGLDPDSAAFLNVVSCWPTDEAGRGRAPSELERQACWPNLHAQLQATHVDYVLACGNMALANWRTDVWITKAHGQPFCRGEQVVMPVLHPSYLQRSPGEIWKMDQALRRFAALVTGKGLAGTNMLSTHCLWCFKPAVRYDEDLWGWCQKHGPKQRTEKEKAKLRVKARTMVNKRRQMEMF